MVAPLKLSLPTDLKMHGHGRYKHVRIRHIGMESLANTERSRIPHGSVTLCCLIRYYRLQCQSKKTRTRSVGKLYMRPVGLLAGEQISSRQHVTSSSLHRGKRDAAKQT